MSNTCGKERNVYTVDALINVHNEIHRREEGAMEVTTHQQPDRQTDSGAQHEQPTMRIKVPDEPTCKPGPQGDQGGFDAAENELLHVLQSLIPPTGENLDQWTWEECRDSLNWCLAEGVLTIQDGRLVPVEELVPTALLTHDTDVDAPKSAEDTGFLRDVERAKPVIASNPAVSAKEQADALGLNSAVYTQSLKVSVNTHKSAQEGAE
jgi:hypothetical protein